MISMMMNTMMLLLMALLISNTTSPRNMMMLLITSTLIMMTSLVLYKNLTLPVLLFSVLMLGGVVVILSYICNLINSNTPSYSSFWLILLPATLYSWSTTSSNNFIILIAPLSLSSALNLLEMFIMLMYLGLVFTTVVYSLSTNKSPLYAPS